MRAVAVDGVAGEIEIALAIPCFLLCAVCPQVRNLAGIEDVLLSFVHDIAPFCGIDCVQTHPEWGVFELQGKRLETKLENLRITALELQLAGREPEAKRGTEGRYHADCLLLSFSIR